MVGYLEYFTMYFLVTFKQTNNINTNIEGVIVKKSYDNMLDEFIVYLKKLFNNFSYGFEIFITDIWCLYNGIHYENKYVTSRINDKGIDSIIIPAFKNNYSSINTYILQISLGNKSKKSLEAFLSVNLEEYYKTFIKPQSNIIRVILALGTVHYNGPSVTVVDKKNLAKLIYDTCIKFSLIKNNRLSNEYLENINLRAEIWDTVNSLEKSSKYYLSYIDILKANHMLIRNQIFNLIQSIQAVNDYNINYVLKLTTNNKAEKFLIRTELKSMNKLTYLDNNKKNLVLFVGSLLDYNFNELDTVLTIRYLSIKLQDSNTAVAHLDWSYSSKKAKNTLFGFKIPYEYVKELSPKLKPISRVNNYLNYTMSTFIDNPDIISDRGLIKELLFKSKEYMLYKNNVS